MKKLIKPFGLAIFAIMLATFCANAQVNNKFKALYLYNFAKNIGWADGNQKIIITVIGDDDFAMELAKVTSTKRVGTHAIDVKRANNVDALPKSQIIYLGESASSMIKPLIDSQKGNKVLIVAGKDGLCQLGAGIAFKPDNGKISYEISEKNISKFGLVCSQKIILLGKSVD